MASHRVKWTVWRLDVWGNEEDGYDVNDRYREGVVFMSSSPTKAEVLAALKVHHYVKSHVQLKHVHIDLVDDGLVDVNDAEEGKPIWTLTRED